MAAIPHRLLTTHVGSLPRSAALTDLLIRQESGEPVDSAELARQTLAGVNESIRRQIKSGVDIVNDGEQPRAGFQTYVTGRMSGFSGRSQRNRPRDYQNFCCWADQMARRFPQRAKVSNAPQATGDVRYGNTAEVDAECAIAESALAQYPGQYVDKFMTAASPGIIATTLLNAFYDSHERYLFALAREMRVEYARIIEHGFILQLDAPDLAMERTVMFQEKSTQEFLTIVEMHVAALNESLAGLPRDRVRLHCCWGNWDGPHTEDIALAEIWPLITQAAVGGLSLEFANPRHQHEFATVKRLGLPEGMVLIPGVIDSTSNYVEHPEVVANRLCEAVAAVGDRERVIAGVDCGFGTFAGYEFVAADVVWAKLASGAAGAGIASERLWGAVQA